MSYYANNEYIISTHNSMNENKYNNEKLKKSGIKALLRPLMKIIKKTTKKRVPAKSCFTCEEEQNSQNEELENRLRAELMSSSAGDAVFVYDQDSCNIVPVQQQFYIPVHFARTEAGTFFWTSASKAEVDFAAGHCYTECQTAEQQIPNFDRWVQA